MYFCFAVSIICEAEHSSKCLSCLDSSNEMSTYTGRDYFLEMKYIPLVFTIK